MNAREKGFLLLSSQLGNPERKPLTTAQLRTLSMRMATMERPTENRELTISDLGILGYGTEMAEHILKLLEEDLLLERYLVRAKISGCVPVTRVSPDYPVQLRKRLGTESPGVLWAKGDLSILEKPRIALVGSRNIAPSNQKFAIHVGREAAKQGYVLVSGNARGADRIAQDACLEAGGQVISVVADELEKQKTKANVLYLSEEDFDGAFSSLRALRRNRVIHALAEKTLVAQCALRLGGTWSGTVQNLRGRWSPVFCFRDGSEATKQLEQMGAVLIDLQDLSNLQSLQDEAISLF